MNSVEPIDSLRPDIYNAVFLPLGDLQYLTTHPGFDHNKKTVIYIHGWLESGKLDLSALAIRGAYLDRGDHNVISVDWSYYAKNVNYRTRVIPQMKVVSINELQWIDHKVTLFCVKIAEVFAEQVRDFVESGNNITYLHLVGHSLGGQLVGKIGRQVKKITNGKLVVPKIIALDPAGEEPTSSMKFLLIKMIFIHKRSRLRRSPHRWLWTDYSQRWRVRSDHSHLRWKARYAVQSRRHRFLPRRRNLPSRMRCRRRWIVGPTLRLRLRSRSLLAFLSGVSERSDALPGRQM